MDDNYSMEKMRTEKQSAVIEKIETSAALPVNIYDMPSGKIRIQWFEKAMGDDEIVLKTFHGIIHRNGRVTINSFEEVS